ncbi:MAG: helix-hairpin-helix domain-containing protein [Phycisphaerae bacterium]|nr:helix-hairpin-helix domain-containing protein [Phycisphaerae bacterium]
MAGNARLVYALCMMDDCGLDTEGQGRTHWAVHVTCYALLGVMLLAVVGMRYLWPLVLYEPIGVEPAPIAAGASGDLIDEIDQRIDPNTATWQELTRLPRIGEMIAKRIVEYRQERQAHGPGEPAPPAVFTCPEDLTAVRGIGPRTVAVIAEHLRFPDEKH